MKVPLIFVAITFFTVSAYCQSAEELSLRGQLYFNSGDYLSAINTFNSLVEKTPKDGSAFYYRGLSKIFLGDNPGGCSDLAVAKSMGTKPPDKQFFGFLCDHE
jgi:hypothetical protein